MDLITGVVLRNMFDPYGDCVSSYVSAETLGITTSDVDTFVTAAEAYFEDRELDTADAKIDEVYY